MINKDWSIIEYQKLKDEITQRIKILHLFILVAILFNLACLFMIFAMISSGFSIREIFVFLLFLPIIFAFLTFNYQANQMTLEGIAGYINHQLRKKISAEDKEIVAWDVFYGQYKKKYQLTSFLKVVPLLLPMLLPIFIFFFDRAFIISFPINMLASFDLILLGLVIFNFRYKIGK